MSTPLLSLEHLTISLGNRRVVDDLNLQIQPGERLALVGESGSGKTVTALSILRLLAQARIQGSIRLEGQELLEKTEAQIRQIRGRDVAMIFQEPMSALNPLFSIGEQIIETLQLHEGLTPREARARTIALLARTGIREPERRVDSYPHQLSGGQLQRAVIAMALACRPKLLIADEPTTALDMTVRARIVQLLLDLQDEELARGDGQGMAILLITHDLNLVRRFAQRVAVMEHGKLVESNETAELFANPRHPYTIKLLNSRPQRQIEPIAGDAATLLQTSGLRVEYPKKRPGWRGWFGHERYIALEGAEVSLKAGETIGVVGESGSGKSTLAQAILSLIPVQGGELEFDGSPISQRTRQQKRALRARLQVVFQDPYGSLSPRQTVAQIVGEGLALHFPELNAAQRLQRIVEVLGEVGLPTSALTRYPHEFSGGQRQRIAIARALVLKPRVVVLDEPTSALDVSIQNQVLQLLVSLQKKHALSYVLISHDLAVVNALAHRLYVMKDGVIVESGDTASLIAHPQHPYTQRLVQASL
ncbi:ABC transporter ATP-binding protein [Pseudomonas fluorescens]|uniref:ABC-type dipeptide transporter n=1 Tax=Pseudomonas fluorescens TaxID=294 RepID=A0A5E7D5A7_PSEFL|nr:dipeptide ABC transporter ATP-binding protein [Pseudomonas fluorescens]VVO12487.1 putative ABC transporter ATP-binding protein YejF [Pseudomonas fluorescens]